MSLIVLIISAAALAQSPALPPICNDVKPRAVDAASAGRPQRLDMLPPAEAYLTVMRSESGCIRPVKVSEERARGQCSSLLRQVCRAVGFRQPNHAVSNTYGELRAGDEI